MACYHPLHASWVVGTYNANGNKIVKVHQSLSNAVKSRVGSVVDKVAVNKDTAPYFDAERVTDEYQEWYLIPCGKCIGCRLDKARDWSLRCMKEASLWEHNYFVTLTYDNEHLLDRSLHKEHLRQFWKDLEEYYRRHYQHSGIRHFASGEYGDKLERPHYHAIIFNLPIYDLKKKFIRGDNQYYTSEILENKVWKRGQVIITDVTQSSCEYVARYVMKKTISKDKKKFIGSVEVLPEFQQQSNRPGIAREWYEQNKDKIYKSDEVLISDKNGYSKSMKPAKYFDKLYAPLHPDEWARVKSLRQRAGELSMKNKLEDLNMRRSTYYAYAENLRKTKCRRLVRSLDKQL